MVKVNECAVYEAPQVELYEIAVEQGISVTGSNEQLGGRDDEGVW